MAAGDGGGEAHQAGAQLVEFGQRQAAGAGGAVRDVPRGGLQLATGRGEHDQYGPFVARLPLAPDQAGRLQPLQQRGERAGVQVQRGAQRLDRLRAALPEHEQDEVLRVGQADLVEQRTVRVDDGAGGRVQREAHQAVEVHGLRHGYQHCELFSCAQSNHAVIAPTSAPDGVPV